MGETPTASLHLQLKDSGSTSRIENPSTSIYESFTHAGLPQELITQILVRLPVKPLLKFKSVSKSWWYLISSSQFTKSHFSKSSREGEYLNHHLLFPSNRPALGMKQCSLYSALHEAEPSTHVYDIECPLQNPAYDPHIVDIVNGLVCLAMNLYDLFIWNPVLRKYKHLPCSNENVQHSCTLLVNHGFGYDESNDDYKVVIFARVYNGVGFEDEVKVYSLRADSWRRIDDLKGFYPAYDWGMYANGRIYWSACKTGDSTPIKKIVSLDMVSEKYGELQHPHPDYEAGYYHWNLEVLGGRSFVLYDYNRSKADLWAMDKYGDEDSWRKVVSIPYDDAHPRTPYSHHLVVCILSNGEIVLANRFGFLVYNYKKKELSWMLALLYSGMDAFLTVPASCFG